MTRFHTTPALLAAAIAALLVPFARATAQTTTVIASTGDAAPGGNGTFSTFGTPVLNGAGQAAFTGVLTGTSGLTTDDRGIFRGDGTGGPVQIAREGQAAPDGNGTFASLFNVVLNGAGQAAFRADLAGTIGVTSDNSGVFRGNGVSGPVQIARTGQAAPDGNGKFSGFGDFPALNDVGMGQVAFSADLTGTSGGFSDTRGINRGDGTAVPVKIVRAGQAAPDGNGAFLSFGSTALNDNGQVAFTAFFTGTSGGLTDRRGIYRGDGVGGPVQIARQGQAAPDGNGTFADIFTPALNDAGQAAFLASFTGTSEDRGIFRHDSVGGLVQIARAGQSAPDGNGSFRSFGLPVLNDAGLTAFTGNLTGTTGGTSDDSGIFRSDGAGGPVQIVREGQAAPDGNGTFSDFLFDDPALNDAGQAAFFASLTGTSGGNSDNTGIFLYDDLHGLLTVAREGDSFLGSTITGLRFNPGDLLGDEGSGLNELGQVSYQFSLADGNSGIAVTTVPEPATVGILAMGLLALTRRRH